MIKVCHLSSVHQRYDTRIYLKECISLSTNFNVSLVIADNLGNELKNKINIFDVGKSNGRFKRLLITSKKIYNKAIELNCDIYHFHDPELIPIAIKLKKTGKKVIFDIHENIAIQILNKDYIPKLLRKIISNLYRKYEKKNLKKFDALILAESSYYEYYKILNQKIEIVLNMPDLDSLNNFYTNKRIKNEIFYLGGISNNRGFDMYTKALKILKNKIPDVFMHLIGPYNEDLIKKTNLNDISRAINLYGSIPLNEALKYSIYSKVGISILKPIGNYTKSYSTKIFEYMAIGLPVVTSNFKLYSEIIDKNNCGICVDPENPDEIAKAIEFIMNHPEKAREMGQNGRKLIEKKYNWAMEEIKLNAIYSSIV